VRWCIVGGLAAGARTEPRFTKDLDVAIAADDDAAAERIVGRLLRRGWRVLAVQEHEVTGRLTTVRLATPADVGSGAVVDLLFATSGIEGDVVRGAEPITFTTGLTLPAARTGHLIAMKLLSQSPSRPQDRIDLVRLVEVADADELRRAREAIECIRARGFHRDRDLVSGLDELLREFGR
jgi:DNA polymerase IIIc chi subunit